MTDLLSAAVADSAAGIAARAEVLVAEAGGVLVGAVSWTVADDDHAVLDAIAVASGSRYSGVGRRLLMAVAQATEPRQIVAETDGDAVGFYRAVGFAVLSLGEQYPGVERFRCSR